MASTDWQAFLRAQGAHVNPQGDSHFPAAGAEGARLFDLGHLACLWVEGPEAARFLQGQVTCDLNRVSANQSRRGAICTLQGRMICSFRLVRRGGDAYVLIMHRGLVESVRQTLAKYIVFSKAGLRAADDEVVLGFGGIEPAALSPWFDTVPDGTQAVVQSNHGVLLRVDGERLLGLLPPDTAKELWRSLANDVQPAGADLWTLADVRAGLAAVEPATAGELLPQMIALHVDEGVSFKKGCYIGQEVVARMHYRGKLKRHLYRAKVNTEKLPQAGGSLFTEGQSQSIGTVIQSAPAEANSFELLAVVTDAGVDADAVYLEADCRTKLQFLPLP